MRHAWDKFKLSLHMWRPQWHKSKFRFCIVQGEVEIQCSLFVLILRRIKLPRRQTTAFISMKSLCHSQDEGIEQVLTIKEEIDVQE